MRSRPGGSLDPAVRGNIRAAYYDARHMVYVREADLAEFREDYLQLMEEALD